MENSLIEIASILTGIFLHYKGVSGKIDNILKKQNSQEERIVKIERKLNINDSYQGKPI